MAIKAPLLYAGYQNYNKSSAEVMFNYRDQDITAFSNATEFVLTGGNFQNYFLPDGNADGYYLQVYVAKVAELANRVFNLTGKKVWIGTPSIMQGFPDSNCDYLGTIMTYFIDNVIAAMGTTNFASRVNGIYMNKEMIDAPLPATYMNNKQYAMFNKVSTYVRNKGKKMLWMPFYDYTDSVENIGKIVHRSNLFDYVLIQPTYYFRANNNTQNCTVLRKSVAAQKLYYKDASTQVIQNSQITHTSTKIGVTMEIDRYYCRTGNRPAVGTAYDAATQAELIARNNTYASTFNSTTTSGYSKATTDFGYYCEHRTGTGADAEYTSLAGVVQSFFS